MKQAIYIGKGFTKEFKNPPVWIEGFGKMNKSQIFYGNTGFAYYSEQDRKWDFRPDGLNIQHLVKRSDLFFIADES